MTSTLAQLRDALADADGSLRIVLAHLEEVHADTHTKPSERIAAEESVAAAQRLVDRRRDDLVAAETTGQDSTQDPPPDSPDQQGEPTEEKPLQFANSAEFVDKYLLELWRRETMIWCRWWYRHGEAVARLEALWRSWESMRWEGPTAMLVWWRDYADPTMAVLTSGSGPFARCKWKPQEHAVLRRVEVAAPPPALYGD